MASEHEHFHSTFFSSVPQRKSVFDSIDYWFSFVAVTAAIQFLPVISIAAFILVVADALASANGFFPSWLQTGLDAAFLWIAAFALLPVIILSYTSVAGVRRRLRAARTAKEVWEVVFV